MSGPTPAYRPEFPDGFVQQARQIVRCRTVAHCLWQRAALVLLLHGSPEISNTVAAAEVRLHPNAVRYWRRRWAQGQFFLEDTVGRGRKATFSPARPSHRQGCGL